MSDAAQEQAGPSLQGWDRFWYLPASPRVVCRMRIVVGVAALLWFTAWLQDVDQWFGQEGRLSAQTTRLLAPTPTGRTLVSRSGASSVVWCGLAASAALAAGVLTPISGAVALGCLLTLVHRGPLLQGPDSAALAMLLLYLLLAPCGRMWSWDARRGAIEQPTTRARVAGRLIQLHLAALLLATGLQQLGFAAVWWNGEAAWWLIAAEPQRLADLTWLHRQPMLWNLATHLGAIYPLAAALLLWSQKLRPWLLGAGCLYWPLLALVTGDVLYCGLMAAALWVASGRDAAPSSQPAQ